MISKKNKEINSLVVDIFFICIIAAIISLAVNFFSTKGFVLISKEKAHREKIVKITAKETYIKYLSKNIIFISVSSVESYEKAHITGSLYIPAKTSDHIDNLIKKNFENLNMPKEVVIYGDLQNNKDSLKVALRLIELGYKRNIYIMNNGLKEWLEYGYPVKQEGM